MSFFSRLEEACATFIERAFAATFPSKIEPAQIARKLVATMQANTILETGRRTAPNAYTIRINPEDFTRLTTFTTYLETQWEALLVEMAARAEVHFPHRPQVRLAADEAIVLGALEVDLGVVSARADAQGRLRLRIVRGVSAHSLYEITRPLSLGRGEENDIVVADPRVSRRHARILLESGALAIEDLESSNGTFVNGAAVQRQILAPGDVIIVGETELRVERPEGAA